ncbi:hypothetical protein [Christiangramia echinicola]|uniref:hypothetical protein n=1 Tax=Christiangramia echinicola TaxID=279359 RepID=UPI000425EB62|nr:hypothetical protein [Christiangramia echinicola]
MVSANNTSKYCSSDHISIRLGIDSDIPQIITLQSFWLNQPYVNKKGFLFGSPYSEFELKQIISNQHLIIATVDSSFAGYFLVDDVSRNNLTEKYRAQLRILKQQFAGKVCPRAQIAISPNYLGRGISKLLTKSMISRLNNEYESVFSMVSKQNCNIQKHIRNNWKIIHQDHLMYYVKLELRSF